MVPDNGIDAVLYFYLTHAFVNHRPRFLQILCIPDYGIPHYRCYPLPPYFSKDILYHLDDLLYHILSHILLPLR